jgi:hypothetical protein
MCPVASYIGYVCLYKNIPLFLGLYLFVYDVTGSILLRFHSFPICAFEFVYAWAFLELFLFTLGSNRVAGP